MPECSLNSETKSSCKCEIGDVWAVIHCRVVEQGAYFRGMKHCTVSWECIWIRPSNHHFWMCHACCFILFFCGLPRHSRVSWHSLEWVSFPTLLTMQWNQKVCTLFLPLIFQLISIVERFMKSKTLWKPKCRYAHRMNIIYRFLLLCLCDRICVAVLSPLGSLTIVCKRNWHNVEGSIPSYNRLYEIW